MDARLDLLHAVCSLPTAPFVEGSVQAYARAFAAGRRLALFEDRVGNLLLEVPGRGAGPRWVFTAHMDHPGFVAREMTESNVLAADFRGGVYADFVAGAEVRFFDGGSEIAGRVIDVTPETNEPPPPGHPPARAARVTIRVDAPVAPGRPGMFDLGPGRVEGGKFYARACDDLAGAAAALAMIDELSRGPAESPVAVLLTRAEEEGFIGALAAALEPQLLRTSDRLVAIECSAMQPYAKQGDGCIIRVGDLTSVFNSSLSYFMVRQAEALKQARPEFKYQRALMPGGTCEATVYDVYGFTAGSVCVALGNYHNMDREAKSLAPESIDLADWHGMVDLFLQLARTAHEYEPGHRALKERLEKRYEKWKHLL